MKKSVARRLASRPFPEGNPVDRCPVCRDTERSPFLGFNWCKCASCGTGYKTSFPDDETIAEFYAGEYRNETNEDYPDAVDRVAFVNRTANQFQLLGARGCFGYGQKLVRVLDVGAACGWFVHTMRFVGHDANGVEPDPLSRAIARRELGLKLYKTVDEVSGEFDIINLSHVLEHWIDPAKRLGDLASRLKPGGVVMIEVPHINTPAAWSAFHAVAYSPKTLANVIARSGLKTAAVTNTGGDHAVIYSMGEKNENIR